MEFTIEEIYKIEEKKLPLKKLICHPAFSHVYDETNDVTGAVCSIYFRCPSHPVGFLFVGVGEIKDLPFYVKIIPRPYYKKINIT